LKLPRDVSGADLAKALARIGYGITPQTGIHIRLTIESPTHHDSRSRSAEDRDARRDPIGSSFASEDRP
jgi:hypothetical protein